MPWNEKFSIMPSIVLGWYHTGVAPNEVRPLECFRRAAGLLL
jgi:hypothetical protein